jgi:hypothetical protein
MGGIGVLKIGILCKFFKSPLEKFEERGGFKSPLFSTFLSCREVLGKFGCYVLQPTDNCVHALLGLHMYEMPI